MDGGMAMSLTALDTLLGDTLWVQSDCSCLQSTLILTGKPSSSSCESVGVIYCHSRSRHMPDSWYHLFHSHSSLAKYSPISSLIDSLTVGPSSAASLIQDPTAYRKLLWSWYLIHHKADLVNRIFPNLLRSPREKSSLSRQMVSVDIKDNQRNKTTGANTKQWWTDEGRHLLVSVSDQIWTGTLSFSIGRLDQFLTS